MTSARWVEVVWGEGFATENPTLPEYVASYLADDAADSGKTTNVFANLAQYSTVGLPKSTNQVLAYNQGFAGSTQITPSKCATATTCAISEGEIEAELKAQIGAGHLPALAGDGMSTGYMLLFPASIAITDNFNNVSGVTWCAEHGSTTMNGGSTHLIFGLVPDLGSNGGCGPLAKANDNVIVDLSHQQNEMITDPAITENVFSWYDNENGEIGDICNQQVGSNTINGHTWQVQKEWSNLANTCVATTSLFSAPTGGFTATPTSNTAAFSASGASTNKLAHISAGIASYSWDFGDGQTGTGQNPTHEYAAGGIYTVNMTATDTLGFTAHASHQVTVSAPPSTGGTGGTGGTGSTGSTGGTGGTGNSNPAGNGDGAGGTATVSSTGTSSTSGKGSSVVVNSGETAQCPPTGGLCVVTVTGEVESAHLSKKRKNHKVVVGRATITLAPGASAKLTFQLNGTGKKLLRTHGRLLVKVVVTIRHGSDAAVVSTRTITIAAPKKKHGKR